MSRQVYRCDTQWNTARACASLLFAVLVVPSGCHSLHKQPESDYRTVQASPNRDTARAEKLHGKALNILSHCEACYNCECVHNALCNTCKAEQLLQEALIADVRFGPAHNTLGTLYLNQGKLYLAAWEFEYATGLMPSRAEPINNLGLVYEKAGRLGQAIARYEEAAELDPTNAEYIGNLAKASLMQGTPLEEVRYLLRDLKLYDDRPSWVAWASDLLGTHPLPDGSEESLASFSGQISAAKADELLEKIQAPEPEVIGPTLPTAETLPAP